MSYRFVTVLAAGLVVAAGCVHPLQLRPRFDQVGEYNGAATARPVVASADDVQVFYGTAPPGFSLRDNELKVEQGFDHVILGTLRADYWAGDCYFAAKADVIRVLREGAYAAGANAVIYATSAYPDEQLDRCPEVEHGVYGRGWAVVLVDGPPPLGGH